MQCNIVFDNIENRKTSASSFFNNLNLVKVVLKPLLLRFEYISMNARDPVCVSLTTLENKGFSSDISWRGMTFKFSYLLNAISVPVLKSMPGCLMVVPSMHRFPERLHCSLVGMHRVILQPYLLH